jgi:2-iminoacetate synthase ThiH
MSSQPPKPSTAKPPRRPVGPPVAYSSHIKPLFSRLRQGGEISADAIEGLSALFVINFKTGEAQGLQSELVELCSLWEVPMGPQSMSKSKDFSLIFTNVCEMNPSIFPYAHTEGSEFAFILNREAFDQEIEGCLHHQGARLFITGGMHSGLRLPGLEAPTLLKTYLKMVGYLREAMPLVQIEGFSPDEVEFLSVLSERTTQYVLEALQDAGLDTISGVGADILKDTIRFKISPKKVKVKDWFRILSEGYHLGMTQTASISYGHFETPLDRLAHLKLLRDFVQKHPGAFQALMLLPVHHPLKENSSSENYLKSPSSKSSEGTPWTVASILQDQLRMLAACRMMLGPLIPRMGLNYFHPSLMPKPPHRVLEAKSDPKTEQWESSLFDQISWGANDIGSPGWWKCREFWMGMPPTGWVPQEDCWEAMVEFSGE